MHRLILALVLILSLLPASGAAQDRVIFGFGRIFSNDFIGDGHDRWRSGSTMWSLVTGPAGVGMPESLGVLWEYRLRTEIISPYDVTPLDRPYVGALSLGVHTHAAPGPVVVSLGLDAVMIGPQTGLADFQQWFHDLAGLPEPTGLSSELPDAVHLGSTAEVALPLRLSPRLTLRPFAEAQAGVEDLFRLGADVILGSVAQDEVLLRDPVTGHLLRGTRGAGQGLSLVAGADWARVGDSIYLPEGFAPQDDRWRARAGLHWQPNERTSIFYGLTWLSPEVRGRDEGQVLGSLRISLAF